MAAILYFIALPFIYLVSVLPFPLLYLVSDVLYFLMYHVVGYRKNVVYTNLKKSFPEKTEEEIKSLCKKFYKHLCNLTLEIFKGITISKKSMLKRCVFSPEVQAVFSKFSDEKKSIILVMGHLGNWEWAGNSFSLVCKQQLYVLYKPLSNKYFDRLIYHARTRFGTKLIAVNNTYSEMLRTKNEVKAVAFIADQASPPESAHWTTFLNQETTIFKGTEKIARKLNYPVVYGSVKKIKRGYYKVFVEVLSENPANTKDGEISELHTKKLERDIIEQPEFWVWSHRRWKHTKRV